MATMSS